MHAFDLQVGRYLLQHFARFSYQASLGSEEHDQVQGCIAYDEASGAARTLNVSPCWQ